MTENKSFSPREAAAYGLGAVGLIGIAIMAYSIMGYAPSLSPEEWDNQAYKNTLNILFFGGGSIGALGMLGMTGLLSRESKN